MIFAFIGLIVGLIMGITGAGGAIIAIPMFQILLNTTLKEATILSLFTVILGTGVNLIGRSRDVDWKMSLGFLVFGSFSNYLSLPVKDSIPEVLISLLLLFIGCFSIWSVWKTSGSPQQIDSAGKISIIKIVSVGLFLGLITTLTGLGGGVLLIPILLRIFHKNYEEALPTSLASILLISSSSLIFQSQRALGMIQTEEIILLAAGALAAFAALRFFMRLLGDDQKLQIRKMVFTIATFISLAIVISKTF